MNRYWLAVVCVLVGSVASMAQEKPAKRADPVMIYMELSQVEVNVRRLREMGIDWEALTEHEKAVNHPAWLRKMAELMVENDLARMIAGPRLTTIANREASIDVVATRATMLPRMVDGKIGLAVTLEIYDPPVNEKGEIDAATRGRPRSSLSTKTACNPGETVLLGQDLATKKDNDGKVTAETATLTFLMADTKMPEQGEAKKVLVPIDLPLVGARPLGSAVEIKEVAKPRRR
jgi:hypothetical protein